MGSARLEELTAYEGSIVSYRYYVRNYVRTEEAAWVALRNCLFQPSIPRVGSLYQSSTDNESLIALEEIAEREKKEKKKRDGLQLHLSSANRLLSLPKRPFA